MIKNISLNISPIGSSFIRKKKKIKTIPFSMNLPSTYGTIQALMTNIGFNILYSSRDVRSDAFQGGYLILVSRHPLHKGLMFIHEIIIDFDNSLSDYCLIYSGKSNIEIEQECCFRTEKSIKSVKCYINGLISNAKSLNQKQLFINSFNENKQLNIHNLSRMLLEPHVISYQYLNNPNQVILL